MRRAMQRAHRRVQRAGCRYRLGGQDDVGLVSFGERAAKYGLAPATRSRPCLWRRTGRATVVRANVAALRLVLFGGQDLCFSEAKTCAFGGQGEGALRRLLWTGC